MEKARKWCIVVLIGILIFALSFSCFSYEYSGYVGMAIYASRGQGTWTAFNDGGTTGIVIGDFDALGTPASNGGYSYVAFPLELIANVQYTVSFEVVTTFGDDSWAASSAGSDTWIGLYGDLNFTSTKNDTLAATADKPVPYFKYDSTIPAVGEYTTSDGLSNITYTFTPDKSYSKTLCFPMTFVLGFMVSKGDIGVAINSISVSGDPTSVDKALDKLADQIDNVGNDVSILVNGQEVTNKKLDDLSDSINSLPDKQAALDKEEASKANNDVDGLMDGDLSGGVDGAQLLDSIKNLWSAVSNTNTITSLTFPGASIDLMGHHMHFWDDTVVDLSIWLENPYLQVLFKIVRGLLSLRLLIWAFKLVFDVISWVIHPDDSRSALDVLLGKVGE